MFVNAIFIVAGEEFPLLQCIQGLFSSFCTAFVEPAAIFRSKLILKVTTVFLRALGFVQKFFLNVEFLISRQGIHLNALKSLFNDF